MLYVFSKGAYLIGYEGVGVNPVTLVSSEYAAFDFVLCSWVGYELLVDLIWGFLGASERHTIEHDVDFVSVG